MRERRGFLARQLHARPLACFAAAFLLGLIAARQWPLPLWACASGLVAAAGIGIAAARGKRRAAAGAMLLLAGLLAGMLRMELAISSAHLEPTRYSVPMTGRVASEPFIKADTGRLIFRFDLDTDDGAPSDLSLRMYMRCEEEAPLHDIAYGQRLRLKAHIWAPDPVTNAHEFDFGEYLVRQGFNGYATVKREDADILGITRDFRSFVIDLRQAIGRRIDALFPANAGLMRALVLGDRSQLSEEFREALSLSGTAHLICISGLHVTLLAAMLAWLLRRVMDRRWANLLAAALLIPYGVFIGFGASFTRALIMFALLCGGPIAGRPSDPMTRLCASMLIWLAVKPLSVGDVGFALSYAASAGIILIGPPLRQLTGVEALMKRKRSRNRAVRLLHSVEVYFPALLCASLAAQLATLPFVVAYFGVQSVISLPFNLVCVPLCVLGYIVGLAALLISIIYLPAAALVATGADALFSALIAITHLGAALPVNSVRIGRYPLLLVFLHWGIVLAASELSRLNARLRRTLPFALIAVAAMSSLLIFAKAWPYGVVFLDAGQADCAVVTTRGHTYMMDIGDTYTPAADYLNASCLHLDGIVLSHPHQDHAGGLNSVLTSFKPDVIYVPEGWFEVEDVSPAVTEGIERAKSMGVEIRQLRAGDEVQLSSTAKLEVFAPAGSGLPESVNDMSILARVTCDGQSVLFTGDLSESAEPDVIPDTDVLKVAHHGSAKATSERFLEACTPDIAVICVGENNYGHPSEETLEKLKRCDARVYVTRDCGSVALTFRGGQWRVRTYVKESGNELE